MASKETQSCLKKTQQIFPACSQPREEVKDVCKNTKITRNTNGNLKAKTIITVKSHISQLYIVYTYYTWVQNHAHAVHVHR